MDALSMQMQNEICGIFFNFYAAKRMKIYFNSNIKIESFPKFLVLDGQTFVRSKAINAFYLHS